MRFMAYSLATKESEASAPMSPETLANIGKFMGELAQAGILVAAEGCMPSSKGAHIKNAGGKITVTDGPFAEAKEIIGGWVIVDVASLDEAKEWASRFFAVAGEGEGYVLQLHEAPPQ